MEDGGGEPIVVDWRAGVAIPFYRATFRDPLGLHARRRFVLEGRELVGLFDEDFDDPDSAHHATGVADPLLAELDRARTGEMRDIVATIQAEQDVVIRAPLDQLLIVQGGPGTGKTAVGLHRAALLLYDHREVLERDGVLIVGPNRMFLRYIAQVLPSLGETSVVQTTLAGLGSVEVRADDAADVAALKGDPRLAEVIERAAWERSHAGHRAAGCDDRASVACACPPRRSTRCSRAAWPSARRRVGARPGRRVSGSAWKWSSGPSDACSTAGPKASRSTTTCTTRCAGAPSCAGRSTGCGRPRRPPRSVRRLLTSASVPARGSRRASSRRPSSACSCARARARVPRSRGRWPTCRWSTRPKPCSACARGATATWSWTRRRTCRRWRGG